MAKIKNIKARQVFDSRGNPTIEAEIHSDNCLNASAIVPSGASRGTHEAFELRDKENKNYLGKSVFKAVENINGPIAKALINIDIDSAYTTGEYDIALLDIDYDKSGATASGQTSTVTGIKLNIDDGGTTAGTTNLTGLDVINDFNLSNKIIWINRG